MPVSSATADEVQPIRIAKEQPSFVITPYVKDIINRSLLYLRAGFPINFSSPTGMGKTTLAVYTAAQLGQPVILIHGEDEFVTSDLVGGEHGYQRKKVVDNFIHSVLKTEEKFSTSWVDNRLTVACKYGFTLLYDEFTRSRPEANNVLLSVLEEKILDLPAARGKEAYLRVHPNFHAVFTCNPEEYAGVNKAQDALMDRMINIELTHYDKETEIAITCRKSGISKSDAASVVEMVRSLRASKEEEIQGVGPSIRACIKIAKVLGLTGADIPAFKQACIDILESEMRRKKGITMDFKKVVPGLVDKYFNTSS
ncbi:gas vesicle protein GvpN [Candidatus Aerophobetes bacterium]|uniref:Gas vesicle protein GvpN n=1 Tax=Aerophobetes bacterium TaxID=2030807 RepID=A0A523RXH4_UNCAE|nr:MAG: gas vesicle protein GvpN [Candidatus Aerophobetes bacterium]